MICVKIIAGLVCPRRSLDVLKIERYFSLNQCRIVQDPREATHIVVVTCGFINRNILESLALIEAMRDYPATLIVGGCLKDIDPEALSAHFEGPVFTTKDMTGLDDLFPQFAIKTDAVPDANRLHDYNEVATLFGKKERIVERYHFDPSRLHHGDREFIIRTGEGCDCRCSYCSHRSAIGPYRSKALERCLEEFEAGYAKGFRYFKLTAMDTGHYGLDIGIDFPRLVGCLAEAGPEARFTLEDLNPMWLNKYRSAIGGFVSAGKIAIIQSPVQSGSPTVLRAMRRWPGVEAFRNTLLDYRQKAPGLVVSTEILIGFPGETDADFESTLGLLRDSRIDFSYVYPYFENEFVESSRLQPKCPPDVIKDRLERAADFFDKQRISFVMMEN